VVVPAAAGALGVAGGIAGGVLLSRKTAGRGHKLLGVQMPSKIDITGVGREIGAAGRQFGKLAAELRTLRQKAESISGALS
jgi:hypothetical protein